MTPLFLPNHVGGLEIATYNIASILSERNHEVHIITSLDVGLPKENMENGFYVHRIPTLEMPILRTSFFSIGSLLVIKKIDPDLIHIQTIFLGFAGLLIKMLIHKPYIVYGHGSDVYLSWRFKRILSKYILKSADAVVALTQYMKRELQKSSNKHIFVIPNGIILEKFDDITGNNLRDKLKLKDKKMILFVGSLRPVKGVRYLIDAMEFLVEKNKNISLVLVGDGEDRDDLKDLVKGYNLDEHVIFVGRVSDEEVPEYMAAADIFVLPSLSEGFGIVLLEAMASGLPIIATNIAGISEMVTDGENGFLVEPKNPEEIADRIMKLLEDDALREIISHNNKEKSKQFSWSQVVDMIESVYMNVLKIKLCAATPP